MKELKKFLIVFGVTLLLVYVGFKATVRPCKRVLSPNEYSDCTCMGKKVNLAQMLGNQEAYEPPYVEHCVGWVKNRTK